MNKAVLNVTAIAILNSGLGLSAENSQQQEALIRLLKAEHPQSAWFTSDFLTQVPLATIDSQLSKIRQTYGSFKNLKVLNGQMIAIFENGNLVITSAVVNSQGKLTSFGAVPETSVTGSQNSTSPLSSAEVTIAKKLLSKIFESKQVDEEIFAPSFLTAVPINSLREQLSLVRLQLGDYSKIDFSGKIPKVIYERGSLNIEKFTIDAQGKVTNLVITPSK